MSDADVRELERRAAASGSTEDHAAWIAARLRLGELSREGVWLCSSLGHARGLGAPPRARAPLASAPIDDPARGASVGGEA